MLLCLIIIKDQNHWEFYWFKLTYSATQLLYGVATVLYGAKSLLVWFGSLKNRLRVKIPLKSLSAYDTNSAGPDPEVRGRTLTSLQATRCELSKDCCRKLICSHTNTHGGWCRCRARYLWLSTDSHAGQVIRVKNQVEFLILRETEVLFCLFYFCKKKKHITPHLPFLSYCRIFTCLSLSIYL